MALQEPPQYDHRDEIRYNPSLFGTHVCWSDLHPLLSTGDEGYIDRVNGLLLPKASIVDVQTRVIDGGKGQERCSIGEASV
jgi:hypothetical protein